MYVPVRSALATVCRLIRPRLSGASVLCYHSVGDNGAPFTIEADMFASQMAYIASRHETVTPSELVRRMQSGKPVGGCVCITFDDGYADNLSIALPILERYGLRAGVFVITSRIGKTNTHSAGIEISMMSEEDLREAHRRGIEVLPHTHSHLDARDLAADSYEMEYEGSRMRLSSIIGAEVPRIVAYPKGRSDEAVRTWLGERGWYAFGTRGGIATEHSLPCDIERNGVRADTSESEFRTKVTDGIALFERARAMLA